MTTGIISSIIASFLFGILVGTYKKLMIPYIKENFTEKVKIYQKWFGNVDFGSGRLHGMKIEINKLGNDIYGEIEFTSGRHQGKKYPIKGRFSSNILTFIYSPCDSLSTSQGSGTFKRLNDGELLKGEFAYFSQEGNEIDSVKCEFKPIKN